MKRIKRFAYKFIMTMGFMAIVTGLMGFQPAHATTTADFSASWSAGASANAEATGVAIAGANATGKILLEEERTRSPHAVLRTLKPPTETEMNQYGTSVYSRPQAETVLKNEVASYDKLLNAAKVKVAKLKAKIKFYKKYPRKVRQLKKQLKKAQKHLYQVKTSWKYKPLLKMHQGVCGRNTGRLGNMVLESFVDCIKASDNELWKGLGWVPELRKAVIVSIKHTNGNYEAGCHNFWFFDIPEGTPDESMVLVVRAFAKVKLTVSVSVRVVGDLTIYGVMKQDGTTCDEETKTVHVDKLVEVPPVTVTDTDTDRALAFGQNQVQADASARAEVQQSVSAQLLTEISLQMQLACEAVNKPPTGEIVKFDRHLYTGGITKVKIVASDPEDGANVNLTYNVTGGASIIRNDPNYPVIEDVEGTNKVVTFYIRAGQTAGVNATISASATDTTGAPWSDSKTWPIVADEF